MEEQNFFNDWYGFLYYKNSSSKTFKMEKNIAGCVGYEVFNREIRPKVEIVELLPGEDIIYLLKRTKTQCKFIPLGKVLPSPNVYK